MARSLHIGRRGAGYALALALAGLALAAGCRQAERRELTVLLTEYKGPTAVQEAQRLAKELSDQGLPDVFVVEGAQFASVCVGRYPSWKDEKADAMLKRVRFIRDARGQFPFMGVLLVPVPEAMPEDPWPLEQAKGVFTLHVASWEAPGRMAKAQAYAAELRREGHEAYVYHGPRLSMVTIGAYGPEIFDEPGRIGQPGFVPKIVDPAVRDLMEKKFSRMRLEGEEVPILKTEKGTTSIATQLVRVPGRPMPAGTGVVVPQRLYRIAVTLTSAAMGLAEGRGVASGVAQSKDEIPVLVAALVRQVLGSLPAAPKPRVGLVGVQAMDPEGAREQADAMVLEALAAALPREVGARATVFSAAATRQWLDAAGLTPQGVLGDPHVIKGSKDFDFIVTATVATFGR